MRTSKQKNIKLISLSIITALFIPISKVSAGSFGAEIFCTMRDGGNDHESSWDAAYTYIKKQKGGVFKTSPYQAASQIIETVVREKEKFSYCVEYLDNLYPDRKAQREQMRKERKRKRDEIEKEKKRKEIENMIDEENNNFSNESFDRYSY